MSYDHNNTYCGKCGSYGGCSCGYEYQCSSCSPDYNPITNNNSVCPQVDGGSSAGGAGGTASGNNSSVHVSVGGSCCNCNQPKEDCCCKDGAKKLLNYLYKKALDNTIRTSRICLYGDIIPSDIIPSVDGFNKCSETDTSYLLSMADNDSIRNIYLSNDVIKSINGTVSLCELSVIRFTFETPNPFSALPNTNNDSELKKEFFYTPKCDCCCSCADGVAQTLYSGLLGSCYNITLANTVSDTLTSNKITYGTLSSVQLIAIDSDIAIFSRIVKGKPSGGASEVTYTIYFGVPTCRIAKFISVSCLK